MIQTNMVCSSPKNSVRLRKPARRLSRHLLATSGIASYLNRPLKVLTGQHGSSGMSRRALATSPGAVHDRSRDAPSFPLNAAYHLPCSSIGLVSGLLDGGGLRLCRATGEE
jgi:hypothetical protein